MSELAKHPPTTIALAALAALGALFLLFTLLPTFVATSDVPQPRALANINLPEIDQAPFDRYAPIADRPLFAVDRRTETSGAPGTGDGRSSLSDYRLAGVIITKDVRIALVERLTSHQVVTLHPGDDLDGRHVDDITVDGVQLHDARGAATLSAPKAKGGGWHYSGNTQ
jgi:hypothetical protein